MSARTVCRTCLEVREEVKDSMESHDDGLDCDTRLTGREVPTRASLGMLLLLRGVVGKADCRGSFSSTKCAGPLLGCLPWAVVMVSYDGGASVFADGSISSSSSWYLSRMTMVAVQSCCGLRWSGGCLTRDIYGDCRPLK